MTSGGLPGAAEVYQVPWCVGVRDGQVLGVISGEYRLSSEDRSGAGDRRAMAQECAR